MICSRTRTTDDGRREGRFHGAQRPKLHRPAPSQISRRRWCAPACIGGPVPVGPEPAGSAPSSSSVSDSRAACWRRKPRVFRCRNAAFPMAASSSGGGRGIVITSSSSSVCWLLFFGGRARAAAPAAGGELALRGNGVPADRALGEFAWQPRRRR